MEKLTKGSEQMAEQDKQKTQTIYPECCKKCSHIKNYPDLKPCSECWNVGKEPIYEHKKHSKSKKGK